MTDSEFPELEGAEAEADEGARKPEKKSKKSMPKKKDKGEDSTPLEDHGRQKALEATLADLTRRYGDGTVV
ncbi:MAG: hypothetical protein JNJ78_25320, partial [Anaerolineae bacterium]|nr:hypothetical protein [Anaerolineae bacterium]